MLNSVLLRNFKNHKESLINFGKGFNVIIGHNGAGKSSIIEAIVYSLYGSKELKYKKEELNLEKSLENKFDILLELEFKGKKYKINRGYNKLVVNKHNIKEQELKKIFSLRLLRGLIVMQDEIKELINQERASEILSEISGVNSVTSFVDFLKENKKDIKKEKEKYRSLIKQSEDNLKEIIKDENENSFLNKLKEEINIIEKEINEINLKKRRTELKLKELKEAILEIKEKIKKIEKNKKEIEKLEKLIIVLEKEKENLIKEEKKLKKEVIKLKEELKEKELIVENYKKIKKIELIKEKIKEIKGFLDDKDDLEEKLKKLNAELKEKKNRYSKIIKIINNLGDFDLIYKEFLKVKGFIEKNKEILKEKEKIQNYFNKLEKFKVLREQLYKKKYIFKTKIEELLNNKNRLKGDGCPLCLRKIDKHSKEEIEKEFNSLIDQYKEKIRKIEQKLNKIECLLKKEKEISEKYYLLKQLEEYLKKEKTFEDKLSLILEKVKNNEEFSNIMDFEELKIKKEEKEKECISLKEKLNSLNKQIKELEEKIRLKKEKEKEFIKLNNLLGELNRDNLESKKEEIIQKYKNLVTIEKEIKEKNLELKNIWKNLETINKGLEEKKKLESKLREEIRNFDLNALKEELEYKLKNEKELEKILVSLNLTKDKELEKLKNLKEKANLLEKLIKQKKESVKKLKKLEKLEVKIENTIVLLERYKKFLENNFFKLLKKETEEILSFLTNNKFSKITIEKIEERNKERYKFKVLYKGILFDPYHLSGGEQTIFSLALRLAIAELATLKEGLDFLILDEPTIHLDKEVIQRFILYLQQNQKFKQLIIVTHDEEFKNIADNLILIQKDEKGFAVVNQY